MSIKGEVKEINRKEIEQTLYDLNMTEFQRKVLMYVYEIPIGETRTYKEVAEAIGHEGAYRAVGTVLRNNPLAPVIPCHRVVRSDGKLGNYSGTGGAAEKEHLLRKEGALK